jgi:DNA repair exonuclease SbcCD ATPase subunit
MGHYGLTDQQYITVQRIVRDDIILCQSSLIDSLLAYEYECFNYDNIENIYPDKSSEIEDLNSEIQVLEDDKGDLESEVSDIEDNIEQLESDFADLTADEEPDDVAIESVRSEILLAETELERLAKEIDAKDEEIDSLNDSIIELESEQDTAQEALEWWLISDWLKNKLLAKGEIILDNEYGTWWGRGTSGQSIELDSVIHSIAKDITKQ